MITSLLLFWALAAVDPMNTNALDIPQKYQAPNVTIIMTVDNQAAIDNRCGKAPKGYTTMGCEDGDTGVITIPNPCLVNEAKDYGSYAHLLCHEIAHKEGWHHINE